jgi:hypothetical protein
MTAEINNEEYVMKERNWLRNALVLSAITGLLALVGCDTPVDSIDSIDGNWLAKEKNPFIGTWGYGGTAMDGTVTNYELEFKTDGTIVNKTTTGGSTTTTTQYYLIKDNYIVISSTNGYTKYKFEAPNNTQIKLTANANPTYYTRVGAENPNASRTFNLTNGLDGYWRRDNLSFGTEEGAMFMYDWYTFNKNGTYHVYHYMNKNKHYIDRGEFSYYIDGSNRLVTINRLYDVTVYYDFTKTGNDAFSWAATSGGSTLGWERFDGETFWHTVQ